MKNPFIKQVFDSSSTPSTVNSSLSTDSSSSLSTVYRPPFTRKLWTALPNFVDCAVFRPVANLAEKQAIRQSLGIPEAFFVVGCVAAVKKHHKRIDYLINEFASWTEVVDGRQLTVDGTLRAIDELSTVHRPPSTPFLLIAGAKTDETAELLALAESLIPGRYKIMTDCSRAQMPNLLRSMDVFVLTSLFEMMPIALLEALASGLPCMVNQHPVLEWMTGAGEKSIEQKETKERKGGGLGSAGGGCINSSLFPSFPSVQTSSAGGKAIDMSQEGALAAALAALTPEWLVSHGGQARERAAKMFSKEVVIGLYLEYYQRVMSKE